MLNAGRIVERGTHAERLAEDGLYRQMWQLQQARQEMELIPGL